MFALKARARSLLIKSPTIFYIPIEVFAENNFLIFPSNEKAASEYCLTREQGEEKFREFVNSITLKMS